MTDEERLIRMLFSTETTYESNTICIHVGTVNIFTYPYIGGRGDYMVFYSVGKERIKQIAQSIPELWRMLRYNVGIKIREELLLLHILYLQGNDITL